MLSILDKNTDIIEQAMGDAPQESDRREKFFFLGILAFFGTLTLGGINLLAVIWLAVKAPPSLVRDTTTGEAYRVRPSDMERSGKEVFDFINPKIHKLHTWTGTIPSAKDPGLLDPDPGVLIQTNGAAKKVTTGTYETSFVFTEAIRVQMLEKLARQTPQTIFDNDPQNMGAGVYVVFSPRRWIQPKRLDENRWKVTVIADINAFSPSNPTGELIAKFNKDIYIQEVPQIPLLTNDPLAQQLMYLNRREGFEVYAILDSDIGELRAPR